MSIKDKILIYGFVLLQNVLTTGFLYGCLLRYGLHITFYDTGFIVLFSYALYYMIRLSTGLIELTKKK